MPGMYVCNMHFYKSDHVNYRLEEAGEKVQDSSRIQFETFRYDGEDSRFFMLNHMKWEDSGMDRVDGATEAAAFVKKVDFKPSTFKFDDAIAN